MKQEKEYNENIAKDKLFIYTKITCVFVYEFLGYNLHSSNNRAIRKISANENINYKHYQEIQCHINQRYELLKINN